MEQKLFEELIAPYATRVDDVVPRYHITFSKYTSNIKISDQKKPKERTSRKGFKGVGVITPDGTFDDVAAASIHYKKCKQWVYNRIYTGEFKIDEQR